MSRALQFCEHLRSATFREVPDPAQKIQVESLWAAFGQIRALREAIAEPAREYAAHAHPARYIQEYRRVTARESDRERPAEVAIHHPALALHQLLHSRLPF